MGTKRNVLTDENSLPLAIVLSGANTQQKDADDQKMRAMRDEIKAAESLRKAAERFARKGQHQQRENER